MKKETRLIIGIIMIFFGVGLLFDQAGFFAMFGLSFRRIINVFWPLIIIYLGWKTSQKGRSDLGLGLIILGIFFQLAELAGINPWSTFWPTMIIFSGIRMLRGQRPSKIPAKTQDSQQDWIQEEVFLWGLEKKIVSESFRGGTLSCFFGGAEIDLRATQLNPEGARLDLDCVFGSIEIRVPSDWQIDSQGSAFLGVWENNFVSTDNPDSPRLIITGSTIFGSVEIKN